MSIDEWMKKMWYVYTHMFHVYLCLDICKYTYICVSHMYILHTYAYICIIYVSTWNNTCAVEYDSPIKKEPNPAICKTWMDFGGIMLSEISPTEKDKYP